jgi:hypothetical protein
MYGKLEPGKKLFRDVSDEGRQERVFKGVALGIVVTGLLLILALLVIPALEGGSSKKGPTQPGATSAETSSVFVPPLKILNWQLTRGTLARVEGEAQNTSSRVLGYAEIWAYFYDAEGRRIWESFTNTVDLGPGMVWRFRIYGPNGWEVRRAEVKVGFWRVK